MTIAPSKVDLELKKAFQDLQLKRLEAQQKLRSADMQAEFHRQFVRRCDLTKQELLALPSNVCTYESVGRMFVKQTVASAIKQLDEKMAGSDEKMATLETSKIYLEKSIKESEDNLREMVLAKKTTTPI